MNELNYTVFLCVGKIVMKRDLLLHFIIMSLLRGSVSSIVLVQSFQLSQSRCGSVNSTYYVKYREGINCVKERLDHRAKNRC